MASEYRAGESETLTIMNDTGVSTQDVLDALVEQHPDMAIDAMVASSMHPGRSAGLFDRDRYVTPNSIFDQFRVALDAAETDDVVSGVLESTEALAFNKISMECEDEAQEDVWNQIVADIDLDAMLRQMWRETFTISQFYVAVLWGKKDFKVRSTTEAGNKSKKTFKGLKVPTFMTILDPLKIIPVGQTLFGQENLAYIATRGEAKNFDDFLAGANSTDPVMKQLIVAKYEPGREEKKFLKQITGASDLSNLYLLDPTSVFRHTATRPDYQRFATVRMKSVFELLDLKQQLRQMERVFLLGGTNMIILVKKGSENQPAKRQELEALAGQVKQSSRVPVIVGDHRLHVEIITPDMDMTLKPERHNLLDSRITSRLYQVMSSGAYTAGSGKDDSIKLARVIARGMESRRHMIYRTLQSELFRKIMEKNAAFTSVPKLNFHPKRISLDFDSNVSAYMQDLRDRGDISRATLLAEVDLDQADEARKRKREAREFDDVFAPTNVPFDGQGGEGNPAPANPKSAGRQQGGMNRQSQKSGPPRGDGKPDGQQVKPERVVATAEEEEID